MLVKPIPLENTILQASSKMNNSINPEPDQSEKDIPPKMQQQQQQQPKRFEEDNYIQHNIKQINRNRPLIDLPPVKYEEKFLGRNRLYVGNLPPDITTDEITKLFQKYGEVSDVYIHAKKKFGFLRLDYYQNALQAKNELNNYIFKGKRMYVRFSPLASIRVKNLSPYVSNEMLHTAFSIFGEIEFCYIATTTRGKSLGEGIVDFKRRNSLVLAKKHCSENMFLISSCLKPLIVEDYEPPADPIGLPEENLNRKLKEYLESRERGLRFAAPGSFEYNYGQRYKELYERFKMKEEQLKQELEVEEQKLEADVLKAQYDYETERLKDVLKRREMERERFNQRWNSGDFTREPPIGEMQDYRFKPENLYRQASQLNDILDSQERELQEEEWRMDYGSRERNIYRKSEPSISSMGGTRKKRPRY